jgi:elongation factor Ts
MDYSAADVKRLREQTGAGMLDCRNALVDADNYDAAVEILRIKGAKDVNKRAERTAAQGLVTAELDGSGSGVLVELNCETDFVAKTELFQKVAADIAKAALSSDAADRLAVLGISVRPAQTTQELIEEAGAALKEKVELGRFARLTGGFVTSYLHKSDPALPPTLGVLAQLEPASGGSADVAQDITHQIAAMRPRYVTRDEVPADVVEHERSIAEQMTREEGKPEAAIGKIVEGRLNAFFKDVVLIEEASVRDQKKQVKQLLAEHGARVVGFARFQVGQVG